MAILELKGVSQEFGGLRALDSIDMAVEEGEIFGIIGPNGAGKTTLFNIITGIYQPSQGEVIFRGQNVNRVPAYKVARQGIARTYQNIRLFKKLSVLDNIRVGSYGVTRGGLFTEMLGLPPSGREEQKTMEQAVRLLELVGLYDRRWEYADSLAYGEQRKLEIARALALNPSLLLLDEPAAGMNSSEKVELVALIRRIREDMQLTILLVEHDMNLVMNICDRIAVLDYGRRIALDTPVKVKNDAAVIQSYLGVEA